MKGDGLALRGDARRRGAQAPETHLMVAWPGACQTKDASRNFSTRFEIGVALGDKHICYLPPQGTTVRWGRGAKPRAEDGNASVLRDYS